MNNGYEPVIQEIKVVSDIGKDTQPQLDQKNARSNSNGKYFWSIILTKILKVKRFVRMLLPKNSCLNWFKVCAHRYNRIVLIGGKVGGKRAKWVEGLNIW